MSAAWRHARAVSFDLVLFSPYADMLFGKRRKTTACKLEKSRIFFAEIVENKKMRSTVCKRALKFSNLKMFFSREEQPLSEQ